MPLIAVEMLPYVFRKVLPTLSVGDFFSRRAVLGNVANKVVDYALVHCSQAYLVITMLTGTRMQDFTCDLTSIHDNEKTVVVVSHQQPWVFALLPIELHGRPAIPTSGNTSFYIIGTRYPAVSVGFKVRFPRNRCLAIAHGGNFATPTMRKHTTEAAKTYRKITTTSPICSSVLLVILVLL